MSEKGIESNNKIEVKLLRRKSRSDIINKKFELIKKYGPKCAYCGTVLSEKSVYIDHYYPLSKFPDKEPDDDNLVLCCQICNIRKSNESPVDEYGNIKILFPYSDRYKKEIFVSDDGKVNGKTDEAKSTIDILSLNRQELIEYRFNNVAKDFTFDTKSPKDIYYESINQVESLMSSDGIEDDLKEYLFKILYANVIASLEAYLSKICMKGIMHEDIMWKYVESYFTKEKICLSEIKSKYDNIPTMVQTDVSQLLFHNIPKINELFKKLMEIELFNNDEDKELMIKAVRIRHDIVHRNGRIENSDVNAKDSFQEITKNDVINIIKETNKLVTKVENELIEIGFWSD